MAHKQKVFENLIETFWQEKGNNTPKISNELEVRFKEITKTDFDNVVKSLKSLGFSMKRTVPEYMLKIQSEFVDGRTGKTFLSPVRVQISGLEEIQEFCNDNDIVKIMDKHKHAATFMKKTTPKKNGESTVVNFYDFNFKVASSVEETMDATAGIPRGIVDEWDKHKKYFRYITRFSFYRDDLPMIIDLSMVRSNKRDKMVAMTTNEANVFNEMETYEIEIEIDNSQLSKATGHTDLLNMLRKTITYVLSGLQQTKYPISINEQEKVYYEYKTIVMGGGKSQKFEKTPSDFIGPSSKSLQLENIVKPADNSKIIDISEPNYYTVTEKADGERHLLFINKERKIYLINTNMKIIFTGATVTTNLSNVIMDGELILRNKEGVFINLYLAFDIYFINGEDYRSNRFMKLLNGEKSTLFRYDIMKLIIEEKMKVKSINSLPPIRIQCKKFYPTVPNSSIFESCRNILEQSATYEYNIDGLIFTPRTLGVGCSPEDKQIKNYKRLWEYSFKWKPPHENTIDFLVVSKRNESGNEVVTPIFQDGLNMAGADQIQEYKTIILMCGYNEKDDGYLNPFEDVLNDVIPDSNGGVDGKSSYLPRRFYPSDPYDSDAGVCNILLKKDSLGVNQMMTESAVPEIFQENTIVEFSYHFDRKVGWRWVPIRVRHDKTAELLNPNIKKKNYGNSYKTANNNWKILHNPIMPDMICGNGIPATVEDSNVYYNRNGTEVYTKNMRNFHNHVKRLLISCACNPEDILIDYACGKAGDLDKWIKSKVSFVLGIDISRDNIENKFDGACVRYLNKRREVKKMTSGIFLYGDSRKNIRNGNCFDDVKQKQIVDMIFGNTGNKEDLGKAVAKNYRVGAEGFNVSSCQFAIHYFFENKDILMNFMKNLVECTKLGGYFIGTCYDGWSVYNALNKKKRGESISGYYTGNNPSSKVKIWEITKEYPDDITFEGNINSLGWKIGVYQDSINKTFIEYLVNYDYLVRVMENYGFTLATELMNGGSAMFSQLYNSKEFKMQNYERDVSFLNRYFIFKKTSEVNPNDIVLDEAVVVDADVANDSVVKEELPKIVFKPDNEEPENEKDEKVAELITVPQIDVLEPEESEHPIVVPKVAKKKATKKNKDDLPDVPKKKTKKNKEPIPPPTTFVPPPPPAIEENIPIVDVQKPEEKKKRANKKKKADDAEKAVDEGEKKGVDEGEKKAVDDGEKKAVDEGEKKARCPKGQRRNKKTGECEPVK